jgi:large-conductance mechanosensitive channel
MIRFWCFFLTLMVPISPVMAQDGYHPAISFIAKHADVITPIAAFIGPLIGFILIAMLMMVAFKNQAKIQRDQLRHIQKREENMQAREKLVLASSLLGELTENKVRGEAFLRIYRELLRNLRDDNYTPQYQETGDYIHQHPSLSRSVFDANVDRLNLFAPKLAEQLSSAYSHVREETEYWNLEASMPRPAAIRMVEMVIDEAEKTVNPFEDIIASLNVIVRDHDRKKIHQLAA